MSEFVPEQRVIREEHEGGRKGGVTGSATKHRLDSSGPSGPDGSLYLDVGHRMNGNLSSNTMIRLVCLVLLIGLSACSSFFFYPSREIQEGPAVKLFAHKDIEFVAPDGLALHGWYFPAENPRGSILVLHGNAQNLSTHVNSVLWLVRAGFNIFIIDYRGYGHSDGKPDLAGAHRDADAALETLFLLSGVDPQRVVVLGQSLGGSIAVYTVAHSRHRDQIRALVIDSAFSSYRRIAREKLSSFWLTWPFQYPLSWTIRDDFSADKWIGKVSPVPVLILQGLSDPVVPAHHAERLYEAAHQPKELWLTALPGHVQSFGDAGVRRKFLEYLATAMTETTRHGNPQK
jgi:fermentation-respiration switch protein FrsA (DUF1100 family)